MAADLPTCTAAWPPALWPPAAPPASDRVAAATAVLLAWASVGLLGSVLVNFA